MEPQYYEGNKAQPGVEPGYLTNQVSMLTTTLLNQTGPHPSVSLCSHAESSKCAGWTLEGTIECRPGNSGVTWYLQSQKIFWFTGCFEDDYFVFNKLWLGFKLGLALKQLKSK